MKWFKHDSTANMDAKLQDVILEYGAEGYGLYWYCLELIAGNVTPENINFELEHDSRIIAKNLGLGVQRVQEIMSHFIKLALFENSNGRISCLKLAKRADDYTTKLVKDNPPQPIENKQVLENPTKSEKVSLDKIRIDKNRSDKNRENTRSKFVKPKIFEIREYCEEINSQINPVTFFNHYETVGWKVGKNPMKDWKAAVRGWTSRGK